MTKVFIGGSRRITRLSVQVRERLERIMERRLPVLIGDANGADKAVQTYLRGRNYDLVEVFCMGNVCRNNAGGWNTRIVCAPKGARGAGYYSVKDEEMTRESTVGLMLWDGKSKDTHSNIARLLDQGKKVVVYFAPKNDCITVADRKAWEGFLSQSRTGFSQRTRGHAGALEPSITT